MGDVQTALVDEGLRADTFTLEIAGKRFWNWTEIELRQSLDCFSSVGFMAPFEPTRREFRDLFRPFSFLPVKTYLGDELVFTGQLTNVEPTMSADGASVRVQCLSLPAVLESCCVPSGYASDQRTKIQVGREYRGVGLHTIATELCKPFGFEVTGGDDLKVAPALQVTYPKCRLEPDAAIYDFLCALAKQRGLVMTDDALGNLVFQVPTRTGNAIVHLEEGNAPLTGVTSHFEPSECFSEVTCIVPKKRGQKAGRYTQTNKFLRGVLRPHSFKAEDTKIGDAPAAAEARLGRMLANMASWDVELPTFRDPQGRRFRPNATLTLKAPSAMVYGKHELLVRDVTLHQDSQSLTCGLGLVLPGALSGEMPTVLPWDESS